MRMFPAVSALMGLYLNGFPLSRESSKDVFYPLPCLTCSLGISCKGSKIGALAYADDIVILGDTEEELQSILDIVYNWCLKWGVKVNLSKTTIIHFRIKGKNQSSFSFKLAWRTKDRLLDIEESLKKVYESASRAVGV